jgi:predicted nucleic acid-binding protein
MLVIDASLTLSWGFPDEESEEGFRLLNRVIGEGATVPSVWTLEIVNALAVAERKRRITLDQILETLALLRSLLVRISPASITSDFGPVMNISRAQGLSAYDAAYLELAPREGLPLATFDKGLRQAAENLGLRVLSS